MKSTVKFSGSSFLDREFYSLGAVKILIKFDRAFKRFDELKKSAGFQGKVFWPGCRDAPIYILRVWNQDGLGGQQRLNPNVELAFYAMARSKIKFFIQISRQTAAKLLEFDALNQIIELKPITTKQIQITNTPTN